MKEKKIYFPKDGDGIPRLKVFENEEQEYFFDTIIDKMGDYISSKNELAGILGGRDVFNYPKPEKMIKEIIRATCDKDKNKKDSIILDFFAGSGTTGHAVMKHNAENVGGGEEGGAFYFGAAA